MTDTRHYCNDNQTVYCGLVCVYAGMCLCACVSEGMNKCVCECACACVRTQVRKGEVMFSRACCVSLCCPGFLHPACLCYLSPSPCLHTVTLMDSERERAQGRGKTQTQRKTPVSPLCVLTATKGYAKNVHRALAWVYIYFTNPCQLLLTSAIHDTVLHAFVSQEKRIMVLLEM